MTKKSSKMANILIDDFYVYYAHAVYANYEIEFANFCLWMWNYKYLFYFSTSI